MSRIVLASHNEKKLTELRRILGDQVHVLGLDEVPAYPEPAEDGDTFEENALIKASACFAATGLPSLADDSGLAIDVLNEMPGVRSARWSGPQATDQKNLDLVLAQLFDVEADRRAAHFISAIAVVWTANATPTRHIVTGTCRGSIVTQPRGDSGFGYDPIFQPDGSRLTMAELEPEQKDAISHRGAALRQMIPFLQKTVLHLSAST